MWPSLWEGIAKAGPGPQAPLQGAVKLWGEKADKNGGKAGARRAAGKEGVMKDELGLYYHARAGDPGLRVYVRRGAAGEVEFRLWNALDPQVWERHPWLPCSVIRAAAELYQAERDPNVNPALLYDINIARALLGEEKA